ncbi:hypothetical protein EYF80_001805 [Liparis tanakae]|uniref:Uncharacterized protein n=1 Tax=Liparis tanakae TaxID=230148 RepID=A0A4Z2JCU7_9TELE|nr:hypothetical protein EYF80_001805 [Liparis tanakae]
MSECPDHTLRRTAPLELCDAVEEDWSHAAGSMDEVLVAQAAELMAVNVKVLEGDGGGIDLVYVHELLQPLPHLELTPELRLGVTSPQATHFPNLFLKAGKVLLCCSEPCLHRQSLLTPSSVKAVLYLMPFSIGRQKIHMKAYNRLCAGQIADRINSHFTLVSRSPSRALGKGSGLGAAGPLTPPETLCNCAALKSSSGLWHSKWLTRGRKSQLTPFMKTAGCGQGALQASDQLNRMADKGSDGQDECLDSSVKHWPVRALPAVSVTMEEQDAVEGNALTGLRVERRSEQRAEINRLAPRAAQCSLAPLKFCLILVIKSWMTNGTREWTDIICSPEQQTPSPLVARQIKDSETGI